MQIYIILWAICTTGFLIDTCTANNATDELYNAEVKEFLLEMGIPETVNPRFIDWFSKVMKRAFEESSESRKDELEEDKEQLKEMIERGRDTLVEFTKDPNFFYKTDQWIETSVQVMSSFLKIISLHDIIELYDILQKDPEGMKIIAQRFMALRMRESINQVKTMDASKIEAAAGFLKNFLTPQKPVTVKRTEL